MKGEGSLRFIQSLATSATTRFYSVAELSRVRMKGEGSLRFIQSLATSATVG